MSTRQTAPVAIVDMGSNTLKLHVFAPELPLRCLLRSVRETRLGGGVHLPVPRIAADKITTAAQDMAALVEEARRHKADRIRAIATSAVREARNQREFLDAVERASGCRPEVISGEEEARLIGRGVASDPALGDLNGRFSLIDIGGGSVECVDYHLGQPRQKVSMPLGAVRMTATWIRNPRLPYSNDDIEALVQAVRQEARRGGFHFDLANRPLIATGGTLAAVRAILAARRGLSADAHPNSFAASTLGDLLAEIAVLPLEQRLLLAGMPQGRADILPTALTTLLTFMELAKTKAVLHSYQNLAYGAALEALQQS